MAEWRIGRGWSDAELAERLRRIETLPRSCPDGSLDETREQGGWSRDASESVVGREGPGEPEVDGVFARAASALRNYEFSDPAVVTGHFRPEPPLEGRRMLLEIRVFVLRYLCPVVVGAVRAEEDDGGETVFGFRYDTLQGHIERGSEWFLLHKDRESGVVRFTIRSLWREGDFPNGWSRLGFRLIGPRKQERWHRAAHARLRALSRRPQDELRRGGPGVVHEGPELGPVSFVREQRAAATPRSPA